MITNTTTKIAKLVLQLKKINSSLPNYRCTPLFNYKYLCDFSAGACLFIINGSNDILFGGAAHIVKPKKISWLKTDF